MSRQAWADAIEVVLDADGLPTRASIAAHLRAAAVTQRYLLRSQVIRGLKESYGPFGCEEASLRDVIVKTLEALERIGDLTAFASDAGPGYVATPERLVALGENSFALLGATAEGGDDPASLVRRRAGEDVHDAGAPIVSLAEEIGLADWRRHLVAAGGMDTPRSGPQALFTHLAGLASGAERLERTGREDLRVLGGRGSFFGDPETSTGRWTAWHGQGAFCSVRSGPYAWQKGLTAGSDHSVRTLDLDADVWRWALAGQTRAMDDPVAQWRAGRFQALTPPPAQIRRLMALAGIEDGAWGWRLDLEPAALALSLLGQDGPDY
jgi:hypothetical protein